MIAIILSYLGVFLYQAIGGNFQVLTELDVEATINELFIMPIGAAIIGTIPHFAGRITYIALVVTALVCIIPNPIINADPQDAILVLSMLGGLVAGLNIRLAIVDDIL
ncbi:MAG: hypothetical protein AAF889_03970 [Cyanobacteria bacterium P01_D01_bin.73]